MYGAGCGVWGVGCWKEDAPHTHRLKQIPIAAFPADVQRKLQANQNPAIASASVNLHCPDVSCVVLVLLKHS